jgi:hypothetical protein
MLVDAPSTLANARAAIVAMGGEVDVFEIGPPAAVAQVGDMERQIAGAIPGLLRRLFLEQSACLRMFWTVEEGTRLPEDLGDGLLGSIDLSLAGLPTDLLNWSGWRAAFEDPAAHDLPTDFTVKDYLSHDASDFNFVILADGLEQFLNTWIALGCPGPEWWDLAHFIDPDTLKLSLTTRRSKTWLRALASAS